MDHLGFWSSDQCSSGGYDSCQQYHQDKNGVFGTRVSEEVSKDTTAATTHGYVPTRFSYVHGGFPHLLLLSAPDVNIAS